MSAEPITQETPQAVPETQTAEKTKPTAVVTFEPGVKLAEPVTEKSTEKPAEATAEQPVEPSTAAPAPAATEPAPQVPTKDGSDAKEEQKLANPEFITKTPALGQLFNRLPAILEKAGHTEIWGVPLKDVNDIPTANVLIKFLRANEGDAKQAEEQLTKALKWRKEINPLDLVENTRFNATKFGGLGYITDYNDPKYGNVIFTWNIYGAVKDINGTFGNVDEFIKWRVALMELAVKDLKLAEATSVIDYDGEDPYQMIQVHDYQNVSFLRMNPTIRAASKKTIEVFSTAYPELLREKFFINVPAIMGWMFTAMKVFLSKNTIRKFHPITNGANLAREFSFANEIPKIYGGKAAELQEGSRTVPLEDAPAEPAQEEAPKEEPVKEEPAPAVTEVKEPAKEEPTKTEAVTTEATPVATQTA